MTMKAPPENGSLYSYYGPYYELKNKYDEIETKHKEEIHRLTEEIDKRQHCINFLCTQYRPKCTQAEIDKILDDMFPM